MYNALFLILRKKRLKFPLICCYHSVDHLNPFLKSMLRQKKSRRFLHEVCASKKNKNIWKGSANQHQFPVCQSQVLFKKIITKNNSIHFPKRYEKVEKENSFSPVCFGVDFSQDTGSDCNCKPKRKSIEEPQQKHHKQRVGKVEKDTDNNLQNSSYSDDVPSSVLIGKLTTDERAKEATNVEDADERGNKGGGNIREDSFDDGVEEGCEDYFNSIAHVDEAEEEEGSDLVPAETDSFVYYFIEVHTI